MLKAKVDSDSQRMTFWDYAVPGIKVIVLLDSGRVTIECDVEASADTITEVVIPVLKKAAETAKALRG